jgi:hypothetical protein
MTSVLLEQSNRRADQSSKQLQERLDQYNKDFRDIISFFPEVYARHKLDEDDPSYRRVAAALDKNKSDMYKLYITANKTVADNHEEIQQSGADIDRLSNAHDGHTAELRLLQSQDVASQQRRVDAVEHYRRQVVELFYLLAGVGLIGGSIYRSTK